MSMQVEDRTVVRGRRERPRDRMQVVEDGAELQPARFTSGMWAVILFISSEVMFFGALFTTYFYLRGRIPEWEPVFQRCIAATCEKPTFAVDPILGVGLPTINTIELLVSSVTMQLAVSAIKKGDRTALRNRLIPTLLLGVACLIRPG